MLLDFCTWFVLSACSITLRTEANRVWEWSAAATTYIGQLRKAIYVVFERLFKEDLLHDGECVKDNHGNLSCQIAFNVRLQLWVPI